MRILLLAFFLAITNLIVGQEKEKTSVLYKRLTVHLEGPLAGNTHKFYPKLSTAISYGKNMVGEDNAPLFERPNYFSMDFRGSYQTVGNNIYDQLWRYPEWGVGYYGTRLFNDTIFGVPNAVFAYIDVPFNKWDANRKWTFSYSIAGGMSFNFRPGNPQDNPLNVMIGSYNNVYIDLGFWANYRLSRTLDAKMGISFVHFSNGASSLPNLGMNLLGAKLILQHNMVGERPNVYDNHDIPEWKKRHGVFIYQAFGSKQISETPGVNYFNSTTSIAYKYWYSYKGQWIVQADLFYDGSNNNLSNVPEGTEGDQVNHLTVGLFLGYEAIYNRWSFVSGWGFNVWRPFESSNSPYYQRFGIRYRVWDGIVLGAGLKAQTFAADYIEWSIGYNLF